MGQLLRRPMAESAGIEKELLPSKSTDQGDDISNPPSSDAGSRPSTLQEQVPQVPPLSESLHSDRLGNDTAGLFQPHPSLASERAVSNVVVQQKGEVVAEVLHKRGSTDSVGNDTGFEKQTLLSSPYRRRKHDPVSYNVMVVGFKGAGKTSLLKQITSTLIDLGGRAGPLRLNISSEEDARIYSGFHGTYVEAELDGEKVGITLWDSVSIGPSRDQV